MNALTLKYSFAQNRVSNVVQSYSLYLNQESLLTSCSDDIVRLSYAGELKSCGTFDAIDDSKKKKGWNFFVSNFMCRCVEFQIEVDM